MKLTKFILIFVIFILSINLVLALGVSPAQTTFEKDISNKGSGVYTDSFKVLPSSDSPTYLTFTVEGPLAGLISFKENPILTQGKQEITFVLTYNGELKKPGIHKSKIIVNEEKVGAGTVGAKASVHHDLNFFIPYPDKYIESDLLLFMDNEYLIKITTVLDNKGSELVDDLDNTVEIYRGPKKILTVYKGGQGVGEHDVVIGDMIGSSDAKIIALKKKVFEINPGDVVENQLAIKRLLLTNGVYKVKSTVTYDGETEEHFDKFQIGTESIQIYLPDNQVIFNQTNKLELKVGSNWNAQLNDVYLTGKVFDKDGVLIDELVKSASFNVAPYENKTVNLYWDASEHPLGNYTLSVIAHFGDKEFNDDFGLRLIPEEQVIRSKPMITNLHLLLIFIVLLILISMIVIVILKKRGYK
ncbi:hypothetical protein HOK51_02690 [Candidatus Woesearchaeota archaeon]|jgi:hypothetical protein|nr:hypothetical protein [Candidatus Woesearchaeota archaeon]MBT6518725.1 hypothetical protein [Candidatus Woesearchaeota archaeon]MBT7367896.1 hypothetical protein [Candidatus Woesearchaeota archaeon]